MDMRCLSEAEARELVAGRVLGLEEAKRCWITPHAFGVAFPAPPDIPYSRECLEAYRSTHVLVFGFPRMPDGKPFSVLNLRKRFGVKQNGICFSAIGLPTDEENEWTTRPPREGWWLIRKEVYPDLLRKSHRDCAAFAEASGWEVPYAADVVYTAIFWQIATGERLLQHHVTWCADRLQDGRFLRVGYNQPRGGFHVSAYPPDDRDDGDRGLMPIVPPDLDVPRMEAVQ